MKEFLVLKENSKTTIPREVSPTHFGQRILVVAPHPDDEIIGCGATLRKCVLAGAEVYCLYLTSGEATLAGPGILSEDKAGIREREALAAGKLIGFAKQEMLRLPDGNLQAADIVAPLAEIVLKYDPSAIFLPAFGDPHPDHLAAYLGVARINGPSQAMCFGYEVWHSLDEPQIFMDVTDSYSIKRKALRKHRLAGKVQNYVRWTTGLNTFRSNLIGGRGFVEVFTESPLGKLKGSDSLV